MLVGKKMMRLTTITALAVSLLIWSAPIYSVLQNEQSDEMFEMADPTCRSAACGNPLCQVCSIPGHRYGIGGHASKSSLIGGHAVGLPEIVIPSIGLPCPMLSSASGHSLTEHGFAQRLGSTESALAPLRPRPIPMATVPMPVGPPPNSFVGGVFKPQQYQQTQPMVAGYGFPTGYGYNQSYGGSQGQGYVQGQGDSQGQGYVQGQGDPQGQGHAQGQGDLQGQGYVQGQGGPQMQGYVQGQGGPQMQGYQQGYYLQGQPGSVPEQRIVYVPYAVPPPIYMQRFAGWMPPVPRPPITMRRILGDANTYEYPEMPYRLYTTRGPRDFLAPNPPGIGE